MQIKLKLTSALQDWTPQLEDDLAQTLLLPWRGLVEPQSFENMLLRSVVPRLQSGLKSLEIDPSDQRIEPVLHLLAWSPYLDPRLTA